MKFLLKVFVLIGLIGLSKITKEDTIAFQKAVLPAASSVDSYVQETEHATMLKEEQVSSTRTPFQRTSVRLN